MTIPRPVPDTASAPFWAALREHRLVLPRCDGCARFDPPGAPWCPRCLARYRWHPVSGRGRIHSWTRVHRPFVPGFDVPYVVVEVEPVEQPGLLLTSALTGDGEPVIGAAVAVEFVDDPRGVTVHRFRLDRTTAGPAPEPVPDAAHRHERTPQ